MARQFIYHMQGLTKAYAGGKKVLENIHLSFYPDAKIGILGPNGSGKSTLLRVLAGLGRAEAGTLRWNGEDALSDRTTHATRVAYLGHHDAVKPGLTVAENLAFWGTPPEIETALHRLHLARLAPLPARMLSAGQKRRLALARLALATAPIWLLDEPTLGLDTTSVAALGTMLAAHRATGGVVLAATHLPLPLPGAETLSLTA